MYQKLHVTMLFWRFSNDGNEYMSRTYVFMRNKAVRMKVKANVYKNFQHSRNNKKQRARRSSPKSSYYCVANVACRSSSRQNEGLRVAERAEQIPILQTANNSLSVAARTMSQNEATVFTMRFHDVIKKGRR